MDEVGGDEGRFGGDDGDEDWVDEQLQQDALERAAAVASTGGGIVVVGGAVALAFWIWSVYRTQDVIDDGFGGFGEEPEFANRVDVFVSTLPLLLFALLAVGVGLGLRLAAAHVLAGRDESTD